MGSLCNAHQIRTTCMCRSRMSDAEEPIPELYREAAERVRQLARQARLADIRSDLLKLAARFERLASDADAAIRLGLPGYPHGEVIPSERDAKV